MGSASSSQMPVMYPAYLCIEGILYCYMLYRSVFSGKQVMLRDPAIGDAPDVERERERNMADADDVAADMSLNQSHLLGGTHLIL